MLQSLAAEIKLEVRIDKEDKIHPANQARLVIFCAYTKRALQQANFLLELRSEKRNDMIIQFDGQIYFKFP